MIEGIGLHSGSRCQVHFHREQGEVRFLRNGQNIPARLECVTDTPRCTILGRQGEQVAVVEHLLAALHLAGWWRGLVVEVSGPELPILDGSAGPWLEALDKLGKPPTAPLSLKVTAPFSLTLGASRLSVRPGVSRLCVKIDFAHPAIGRQCWHGDPASYAELASARTFGFLSELQTLRSQGLAGAASLENAVVFDAEGPLRALRFPDEPVRHKALDVLGDTFLLGRPLQGELNVISGSHRTHIGFMREMIAYGAVTL